MMQSGQAVTPLATENGDKHAVENAARNAAHPVVAPPLLLEGLHKSFGAQKVLNGIDLIVHGGDYGADLYERARRAPEVVEQRPKISLSQGALMKVVVDQDLI